MSAYRKSSSCETTLLKLVEDWKLSLDNGQIAGIISTNTSKAIDSLFPALMIHRMKISSIASEGMTDKVKEITIAEQTVKVCLLHFRLEYLRKCVTDRIYFHVSVIWLDAFTGFNDRGS